MLTKPTEYWEKVLNVNLTGVMMTDRAVAQRPDRRGQARIDREHRLGGSEDPARGVPRNTAFPRPASGC